MKSYSKFDNEGVVSLIATRPHYIGIDIGGTLVKLAMIENFNDLLPSAQGSWKIAELPFLFNLIAETPISHKICLTGGGAFKNQAMLTGLWSKHELHFVGEMRCIGTGANDQAYALHNSSLTVNVGSGVSVVVPVKGTPEYRRVAGSTIGGGTFMGLVHQLLGHDITFNEAIELAMKGKSRNCDLTVGDIYGSAVPGLNDALPANVTASSLAKLDPNTSKEDAVAGYLNMVIFSIANLAAMSFKANSQIALLFTGGFFSDPHDYIKDKLEAVLQTHWQIEGHIVEGSPFVGALGALFQFPEHFIEGF